MKKLIFYSILIIIFLSCEKKKDPTPIDVPILKGFTNEATYSASYIEKSHYSLTSNGTVNILQKIDTTINAVLEKTNLISAKSTYELTENIQGGYNLSGTSNFYIDGFPISNSILTKSTSTKVTNIYEFTNNSYSILDKFQTTVMSVQINNKDQIVSCKGLKLIFFSFGVNGKFTEYPYKNSARYEYDSNGNVIKVFAKLDDISPEYLLAEYTHDQKHNPFKTMKWFNRFFSHDVFSFDTESTNNILIAKTYDSRGILNSETTYVYEYDPKNSYPISVISILKSGSSVVNNTKTTFKY